MVGVGCYVGCLRGEEGVLLGGDVRYQRQGESIGDCGNEKVRKRRRWQA